MPRSLPLSLILLFLANTVHLSAFHIVTDGGAGSDAGRDGEKMMMIDFLNKMKSGGSSSSSSSTPRLGDVDVQLIQPLCGPGLTDFTSKDFWDGDLAVPLSLPRQNTTLFVFGDVQCLACSQPIRRVPNAVVWKPLSQVGDSTPLTYQLESDKLPKPVFPLLAMSTVPAGLISPDGGDVGERS